MSGWRRWLLILAAGVAGSYVARWLLGFGVPPWALILPFAFMMLWWIAAMFWLTVLRIRVRQQRRRELHNN